jgi:competence protein ComEA
MSQQKRAILMLSLCLSSPTFLFAASKPSPIDINTATAAQLMAVNGIGASKAKAIISYRQSNGAFSSVKELEAIRGISDKQLAQWGQQLTVAAKTK